MKTLIAYFRVSTREQGKSGLGIEARQAVARFAAAEGFEIIGEYVEVETGKGSDALERRPSSPRRWPKLAATAASRPCCRASTSSATPGNAFFNQRQACPARLD